MYSIANSGKRVDLPASFPFMIGPVWPGLQLLTLDVVMVREISQKTTTWVFAFQAGLIRRNVYMTTNESRNQLRRQNGIIAGVCGGLGAFFGISPLWFRLLFVLLLLPGGLPGILPYLVLWIIIPRKRD